MSSIYSFQASTRIYQGELLYIDDQGRIALPKLGIHPQIVGYAMDTVEEGETCQAFIYGFDAVPEKGPLSFYAPKNPLPYENLEFEFDLKIGKPKTPVFQLIFEGFAQTFREMPIKSRQYHFCEDPDYYLHPHETDEPYVFHDGRAIANYQYDCTIIYDKTNWFSWNSHEVERHYELLLCVIGKQTYVFQQAHLNHIRQLETQESSGLSFYIYVDKREIILHEEKLQEKTDPRFNIELGECNQHLPAGKHDIEIEEIKKESGMVVTNHST